MSREEKFRKAWDNLESEPIIKDAKDKLSTKIGKPISVEDLNDLIGGIPDIMVGEFVEDFQLDVKMRLELITKVDRIRQRKTVKESTIKTKTGVKAAQIAAQRFQRRVDIAEFVLFRVHTPHSLFSPLSMGKPIPKFRIDWKATLKEWNQTQPLDQMTNPHVFSSIFSRILTEDEVLQEILRREMVKQLEILQLQNSVYEQLQQLEQSERFQELPLSTKELYYKNAKWIYLLIMREAPNERIDTFEG